MPRPASGTGMRSPASPGTSRTGEEVDRGGNLPDAQAVMATGAVSGLIFDELVAGRTAQLPSLLPDLLFAMLVPYIGPGAATEEMRRAGPAGPLASLAARLPVL